MRVLLWHGWLLEGSGSSIYAARTAEVLRGDGHDVLLVCQERHVERYRWIDASGTVDATGPSALTPNPAAVASDAGGRCVLCDRRSARCCPCSSLDEYEGFTVRRFVDLDDAALEAYLAANVDALQPRWRMARHAGRGLGTRDPRRRRRGARARGRVPYVAKIHGSDLEYAIREQPRFAALAAEGLGAARAVVGASRDVLDRCAELVPGLGELGPVVAPGLDAETFRPRDRREALLDVAARLRRDADVERGRPSAHDDEVRRALGARDPNAFDALAARTTRRSPSRARRTASRRSPLRPTDRRVVREADRAEGRAPAARGGAVDARPSGRAGRRVRLVPRVARGAGARRATRRPGGGSRASGPGGLELAPSGRRPLVTFTGRLDHRYAPDALAAMDVLVVPSILAEAFGMVAIEGVAAGALPLVARHSGLGEIAAALEAEIARPGLFSFAPGEGDLGADRERARRPARDGSGRARGGGGRDHGVRGSRVVLARDGAPLARRGPVRPKLRRGAWRSRAR